MTIAHRALYASTSSSTRSSGANEDEREGEARAADGTGARARAALSFVFGIAIGIAIASANARSSSTLGGSLTLGGISISSAISSTISSIVTTIQNRFIPTLQTASYMTATCTTALSFHGWCESNSVIYASGCLTTYAGTKYYQVGAPYPVYGSTVNAGLRNCVLTYYTQTLNTTYANNGISLDATTLTEIVKAMFPDTLQDMQAYVDAFQDADVATESDFGADTNFGSLTAGASAMVNAIAVTKYVIPSTSSCSDSMCVSISPSDLGLKTSYSISVPNVCASFRILGKTYKKCISVPKVTFKIPNTSKQLCVNVPGYCTIASSATKFTQLTSASSITALTNLNMLQGSVTNAIADAQAQATKFTQLTSASSITALTNLNMLQGSVVGVISDAQNALREVAEGLENKLRDIVEMVWGNMVDNADDLRVMIENGFMDALDSASSSRASLGLRREHQAEFFEHVQEGLRRAFRGEALENVEKYKPAARLGSASKGSCLDIGISLLDDIAKNDYLMPWPDKLASDPLAPGSFGVKFPALDILLCAKIEEFKLNPAIATRLFDAFTRMFEAMFVALYDATGLNDLVEKIQALGNGKFFNGRRLLSVDDQQQFVELHLQYKDALAAAEANMLRELMHFHERLYASTPLQPSARASMDASASLGAGAFDAVIDDFVNDLTSALQLMGRTTSMKGSFTLGFKTSTSIYARHAVTQTGEFLADHLDMDNSIEGVKIISTPIPGIMIAIDYKVSLNLPYFFKADAEGEFGVDVEVDFPLNVNINADSPGVSFSTPTVRSKLTKSGQIIIGLQMGVVAQVEHAYVALCAGPVCAGPELWARQDVYVGLDAFAMTLDRSQATCTSDAYSLTALWNNWDYGASTKAMCAASLLGVGGYLQIPKTQLALEMLMKPIPTAKPSGGGAALGKIKVDGELGAGSSPSGRDRGSGDLSLSPSVSLFDFTPLIETAFDMSGNFHMQELFSACTSSRDIAPTGCTPTCVATVKFKGSYGDDYKNRCLTSRGGLSDLPVLAACVKDAKDSAGRQSQWWQLVKNTAGAGSRVRLAETFLCLEAATVDNVPGGPVIKLATCNDASAAQLFEYVAECGTTSAKRPCLRTIPARGSSPACTQSWWSRQGADASTARVHLSSENCGNAERASLVMVS